MKNIALKIAYNGRNFSGYQYQPGLRTVEAHLLDALEFLVGQRTKLYSAGRTDKGVHALGQVANFRSNIKVQTVMIPQVMNCYLPDDVSVIQAKEVPMDFHARYWAKTKHYRYTIYNNRQRNGFFFDRVTHIHHPLDHKAMERALKQVEGAHDFRSFMGRDSSQEETLRGLDRVRVHRQGPFIYLDFYGRSFLKNMVRILVGTAIEVGQGKRSEEGIYEALMAKDRTLAGTTAPAGGLTLMRIYY
ncbi:MAG: tRNA pseudouridine(38-40) synthase TruA [Tissierellia bacterium]|nr:tRNA pseudouridine(38-40) synthase TruA [Tissierellia bacterium]